MQERARECQCQANNIQNVLRNTLYRVAVPFPFPVLVSSRPNSKTVKISSQLATPQSANIERERQAELPARPAAPLQDCRRHLADNISFHQNFNSTSVSLIFVFHSWNFSQCRLLFLAICLFANCLPVMLILFCWPS